MRRELLAGDALVLAQYGPPPLVAEALHHLGVTDDVGEQNRAECRSFRLRACLRTWKRWLNAVVSLQKLAQEFPAFFCRRRRHQPALGDPGCDFLHGGPCDRSIVRAMNDQAGRRNAVYIAVNINRAVKIDIAGCHLRRDSAPQAFHTALDFVSG